MSHGWMAIGGAVPDLGLLIVQIGVVVVSARLLGLLFRRIHQPQVIGEMVAGILLGPSLLGWLAPGLSAALFPPASLGFLNSLSQIGLLLFMFLVGLEINPKLMRGRAALVISQASIVVPFCLGAALAWYLYPRLSDPRVGFTGFALFMGAAMSVTAFPVLARILAERGLLRTRIGSIAIACAAVNDVTAWCILAGIIVLVRATGAETPLWFTVGGSLAYLALMAFGVRPLLRRLETWHQRRGWFTQDMLTLILVLALGSAWVTEWLGIHALFGAFLVGVLLPEGEPFVRALTEKLEDLTVVLLLPLYFAFTGLRTSIGLVSGAELWMFCAVIILVAIAGKFGGATLAARAAGQPWRDAAAIGILMNTRGLVELVILNVGLDIGVLSPPLFAMMVLMALVTTFMTSPLLELVYPTRRFRSEALGLAPIGQGVTAAEGLLPPEPPREL